MKKLTDNQTLVLMMVGTLLAIGGFGMLLSVAPEFINPPAGSPTPGAIPVSKYRENISDVTLINQNGEPMALSALRGKPTLIAFGYTSCPDVCPLTLADFKQVKTKLGAAGDQANFAMIFVDPKRDTPEVLQRYMRAFDPGFVGLTGDKAAIDKAVAEFDGAYSIEEPRAGSSGYLVAHSSFLYLLDAKGVWRTQYPFQTAPDLIAADLRAMIQP
jgi:protein SCO1